MNQLDDFARLASGHNGQVTMAPTQAAVEHFQALNADTRRMVLQLLDSTDDPALWQQLDDHPDSHDLSQWLVTLPRMHTPPRGKG